MVFLFLLPAQLRLVASFQFASFAAASRAQSLPTMSVFHRRKGEAEGDVEAGGREDHSGSTVAPPEPQAQHQAAPQENLPEYAALERYISTYREGSRMGDDNQKKRRNVKWWQFWRSTDADLMDDAEPAKRVVPEAWLDTDIQTGIRINEVDERRKWSGWNELSAEKENMFVKFLGFFTGPILYGESFFFSFFQLVHANGWKINQSCK
jgi:H+-transporting ATPase